MAPHMESGVRSTSSVSLDETVLLDEIDIDIDVNVVSFTRQDR